jgi:membrane-associated protease RseP (regulator of RpoE activity)
MRTVFALALLTISGVACGQARPTRVEAMQAPAPGTLRLAPDAESRWVPFELTPGNQIRFHLTLDGRTLAAVLDTGVSVTVLSRTSAAVDASRLQAGGLATAIGGTVPIAWMPTREIVLGALTRNGGAVAVTDLPARATGSAAAVDVLVGRDLLEAHALDIDYAGKRFRLLPSGRLPFTGSTAPLSVSPGRQVYESRIALGGQPLAPIVVDTGDGSAVTVTQPGWTAAGLDRLPMTSTIAYGLAGPLVSTLAIVPVLKLGTLQARSVEVRIEPPGGFSQAIGAAGRIGSGFLQNYRVLLDPRAGRMVLSPLPTADQPPLRSTSGLLLGVERSRLKVLHVMANGPAAAAGWRPGDTICAIDGQAIPNDYPSSSLARWSVGEPGTVVRLRSCDGRERALTLRQFY